MIRSYQNKAKTKARGFGNGKMWKPLDYSKICQHYQSFPEMNYKMYDNVLVGIPVM